MVLLAGCATTPPSPSTPTPSPATTAASPTDTAATDPTSATGAEDESRNTAARQAIETAEGAVGGRAVELEWSEQGWKADVVVGDVEHELLIAPAGDTVTRTDTSPEKLDADKLDRLTDAFVTMRQAVDTVLDQIPGDLLKADLESDSAPLTGMRWDVTVDFDGDPVTLTVDAGSGDIREG